MSHDKEPDTPPPAPPESGEPSPPPDPPKKYLERSSVEVYAGLILAILLGAVPMNAIWRSVLLFGVLCLLVDITWRARWTINWKRRVKVIATSVLAAIYLGVAVTLIVYEYRSTPALFNAEMRLAYVTDSGPLTHFMVAYPSRAGETLSPVFYLTFIQITNLQAVPSSITDFEVAVGKGEDGPWENLPNIPLASKGLLNLTGNGPRKILTAPPGTYRMNAPRNTEHLKQAAVVVADPKLENELANPIPPHHTIRGWLALDVPSGNARGQGNYFRIKLRDAAGKSATCIMSLPSSEPDDPAGHVDNGKLLMVGEVIDVSGFKVKNYSAPSY
jgi:hypothetical protein